MMKTWKEISPEELEKNPFHMIGKEWMLVTAKKEEIVNTMTVSWGGLGVMWNRNVAYVVIRPQRYTKELIDYGDAFSLTILDETYRKTLSYLGSVSGRDEDKIKNSALTIEYEKDIPYFQEGNTVLLCKKLFSQPLSEESFFNKTMSAQFYPNKDYHVLYICEIKKIMVKQ